MPKGSEGGNPLRDALNGFSPTGATRNNGYDASPSIGNSDPSSGYSGSFSASGSGRGGGINKDFGYKVVDRKRPPKEEKQKKGKVRNPTFLMRLNKVLFKALEEMTEFNDLVDALYDALPKKFQTAKYFSDRPKVLYDNFNYLNVDEAFKNIIFNSIEDKVIGISEGKLQNLVVVVHFLN